MKITTSMISHVIEVRDDRICSLVVENPICFRKLIEGLHEALEEGGDDVIVSEDGDRLKAEDSMDLIHTFVPFHLNTKSLLMALLKRLEKIGLMPGHREETESMLANINGYVDRLTLEIPHPIISEGITLAGLLKNSGLNFDEEVSDPVNLLLDYFRLVREFVGDRVYVLVNCRSYFSDSELIGLFEICLAEKLKILLIDSCAKAVLPNEDRLLVDNDLCELTQRDDNMV